MSVFCLSADEIDTHWPLFAHHVERLATETGHFLSECLKADLEQANKQLWGYAADDGTIKAIGITHVSRTSRGSLCEVVGACGAVSKDEINAVREAIERWAKSIGCTRVRFGGRVGWKRVTGYRQVGIILERDL